LDATVCAAVASDKRFPPRDSELAARVVKLGLNVGYWGLGAPPVENLALVQEAERLGFDSVWAAEAYGSDAATVLAWLASQTTSIKLGSGIFQIPARSAAMTAMTTATLDHLSNGRFRLGLGTSGPQVSEGWHGVRFAKQLARTRDYVEVVRMMLRRERVDYHGETLELPLPGGPGKALKLTIGTVQSAVPIYIAAIGPRNTALTAEIADGWLPILVSPEHFHEFRPALVEGWAKAGRSGEDFDIAPSVQVRIDDDLAAAHDSMRHLIALYVGGMGSRTKNFYNALVTSYGFGEVAREVQDLYLDGKRNEAAAALPAELIDAVTLCGPAARVRDRLAVYRDVGVGTLIVSPVAWTLEDRVSQLRRLVELNA